jgi:hypothetical protein
MTYDNALAFASRRGTKFPVQSPMASLVQTVSLPGMLVTNGHMCTRSKQAEKSETPSGNRKFK